jgi:quinol monooxygenase YgiN
MAIRIVVTMSAAPGRGEELARFYAARALEVKTEPGCEQYEAFRSLTEPDRIVLLERWSDEASLERHAQAAATRAPPQDLRHGRGEREDYIYRRTR